MYILKRRQNGNGINRQNSGGSFPNRDPDRDSLDEYGEDRFGEDTGSLIGAYNDDRGAQTVGNAEFVWLPLVTTFYLRNVGSDQVYVYSRWKQF